MVHKLLNYLTFGVYNYLCQQYFFIKQGKLMRKYGHEILSLVNGVSKELNKPIWLEFGTLLGAYRDKSFIGHDYDMDLGMYLSDYDDLFERKLIEKGFEKKHWFTLFKKGEEIISEVTWSYGGFNVDFFLCIDCDDRRHVFCYGKKDEESFSQGKWEVLEYIQPNAFPIESVYIDDIKCSAPARTVDCLKKYYGENFMIPQKGCSATDKTNRVVVWNIDDAFGKISMPTK